MNASYDTFHGRSKWERDTDNKRGKARRLYEQPPMVSNDYINHDFIGKIENVIHWQTPTRSFTTCIHALLRANKTKGLNLWSPAPSIAFPFLKSAARPHFTAGAFMFNKDKYFPECLTCNLSNLSISSPKSRLYEAYMPDAPKSAPRTTISSGSKGIFFI